MKAKAWEIILNILDTADGMLMAILDRVTAGRKAVWKKWHAAKNFCG